MWLIPTHMTRDVKHSMAACSISEAALPLNTGTFNPFNNTQAYSLVNIVNYRKTIRKYQIIRTFVLLLAVSSKTCRIEPLCSMVLFCYTPVIRAKRTKLKKRKWTINVPVQLLCWFRINLVCRWPYFGANNRCRV